MKAMLFAFLSVGVIAFAANFYLNTTGFTTKEQATGASVRLD